MTRILLLLVLLGFATGAHAQSGGSSYVIGGIEVDAAAKNTYDARMAGYRLAREKAWPLLWTRLTGLAENTAPRLSDSALQAMVAGIEIERERFSTTRYLARLGVVFDRARAAGYFQGTAGALQSGPKLLLPIFTDGGTRILYQAKTPWVSAWLRFSESLSPIDYVLASGSAGDNILLTAYQTQRGDRNLWRNIVNRFGTTDVIVAEVRLVRSFPGGPVSAEFIARHGPDATELGRFSLRATSEAGLDPMLDDGVRGLDRLFTAALREGRLEGDTELTTELEPIMSSAPMISGVTSYDATVAGVEADVATPDARSWQAIESALRAVPGVGGVSLTSLSLGGVSRITIRYSDTLELLRYRLDQAGLRLEATAAGALLRRKQAGDAPVPAPVVAAPVVADDPDAPLPGAPAAPPAAPEPAIVPPPPAEAPRRVRPERRPRAEPAPPSEGPADLLSGTAPQ